MSARGLRRHPPRRTVLRDFGTAELALAAPAIIRPAQAQGMSTMEGTRARAGRLSREGHLGGEAAGGAVREPERAAMRLDDGKRDGKAETAAAGFAAA